MVPRLGFNLGGGGLQFFSGPLPQNFIHIIDILSSSPVVHPLFEQVG